MTFRHRHLLGIEGLSAGEITEILDIAEQYVELNRRGGAKSALLRGRTMVNLFFESSTRTRTSFELAGKRLGADVINMSSDGSSVKKGETLLDTAITLNAMHVDVLVVRHPESGAVKLLSDKVNCVVMNGGDGQHEHPTQALLDAYTLRAHRGPSLDGCRVAIVGDVRNSRVARSDVKMFHALGCEITLVGPPTLLPERLGGWPVTVAHDLDEVCGEVDVLYMLRIQRERIDQACFPSLREYASRWGLTPARMARCKPDTLVMHPGPMNRGIEIAAEVADSARSLVAEQVANGVAVRMAVLWTLLGAGGTVV